MATISTSACEAVAAAVVTLAVLVLLFKLLHFWLRSLKDAQEADAAARRGPAGSSGDGRVLVPTPPPQQPAAPVAVAVEMERLTEPLVCTYLRADGWPAEVACAVCLAELADGEAVRVLPACMHYFHAACVGEWLRTYQTCPLCRAPLVPPAGAGALR